MSVRWSGRQVAMLEEMRSWPWPSAWALQDGAPSASPPSGGAGATRAAPDSIDAPITALPRLAPSARPAAQQPAPTAREARPEAAQIAALDWPALRAAVAVCTACALCEKRTQTVFGVGNERAHWMIVGEAPGEQEDLRGEPFVGKAGRLLDNMLAAIGLTRAEAPPERQVFIANTLKCRPPGNRNPLPEELAQCEPFLVRQLALVQPRIVLAMGRFAVQSLLRSDEPIGRLRGRVHRYEGRPLVVTYHPAYLLRNPLDKARAWEDLCLAREVAQAAP